MTRLKYSGTTYRSAAAMQGFFCLFLFKVQDQKEGLSKFNSSGLHTDLWPSLD